MRPPFTLAQLNPFRTRLQQMARQLEVQSAAQQAASQTVELDQSKVGRLSRMDAMQQQALALATQQRARRNTRRIQAALARIDSGRFGLCPDCDQAVETARLHADPCTLFCMDCAEERDDQAAAEARQRLMRGPRG
ncbi:MAG: TraR/DksA family transcriptional regulator [Panacagrimonas sp.]